jgi:starvation-inducible DNA-binding protein
MRSEVYAMTFNAMESSKKSAATEFVAPSDLPTAAVADISELLRKALADVFTLYLKTKNFHWHMSGPHFRDYHILLDEQASQLFAITDPIAERVRKIGGRAIRSIADVSQHRRLADNDEEFARPETMLCELANDNRAFTRYLRAARKACDSHHDVATASLIEVWIDEAERRTWFLREAVQGYK